MNFKYKKKVSIFVLISIVAILSISEFQYVNASPTLILVPNTGNFGTIITTSGTGYTPSGVLKATPGSQSGSGSNGWFGDVWTTIFKGIIGNGLTPGSVINKIQLNVTNTGNGQQKEIYDNGHSNTPSGYNGRVFVLPFTTILGNGLTPGSTIQKMALNVTATGIGNFVATGIDSPISEMSGLNGVVFALPFSSVLGNGLISGATISKIQMNITSTGAGTWSITHNFNSNSGPAWDNTVLWAQKFTGLDPGTTITSLSVKTGNTVAGNIRVKIYDDSSGSPHTLLGESGSVGLSGTNTENAISVSATVPSNGIIWGAFEVSDNTNTLTYSVGSLGEVNVAHTYGSGPNPFGTASSSTSTPWEKVTWTTGNGNIRVKIYDDTGSGSCGIGCPGALLGESGSLPITTTGLQNFTVSATVPGDGVVWGSFETDNIHLGIKGDPVTGGTRYVIHTYGSGPSPFGTVTSSITGQMAMKIYYSALSNIRVKIYQDNGANSCGGVVLCPSTLLGESGSLPITTTGLQNFTVSATVPASGIVYAGFESDNSAMAVKGTTGSTVGVTAIHTYGSGPSPFGSVSSSAIGQPYIQLFNTAQTGIRVKIYADDGGGDPTKPSTLLGEGGPYGVSSTGLQNFTVSATVPGDGNVFGAFETNSTVFSITTSTAQSGPYVAHTFGSGPSPFGVVSGGLNSPFLNLFYTVPNNSITFLFNGNPLTTSPSTVITNSSGGFSGVTFGEPINVIGIYVVQAMDGFSNSATANFNVTNIFNFPPNCSISQCTTKLVNYTFHRTPDFSQLILTVHVLPQPFNIECNYKNGTFIGPNKWVNFTNISVYQHTDNVPKTENVYVGCYGSGLLLSFTSPGNSTLIVQGANVFNSTFGVTLGVPIGVFFIAMLASLANQRTGPIYVVVVLAAIGVMSAILFFTVPSGAWALVLITGFLGIFVGRKIF
jgi:hypothetical protein